MRDRARTLAAAGWLALLVNTAYIAALPSPTLFYMGNVVLHLVLGLALTVAAFRLRREAAAAPGRLPHMRGGRGRAGPAQRPGAR